MTHLNCDIPDLAATSEPYPELAATASNGSALQWCSLGLLSPADPLIRLLKADGVSEAIWTHWCGRLQSSADRGCRFNPTWQSALAYDGRVFRLPVEEDVNGGPKARYGVERSDPTPSFPLGLKPL
jgi:hypothetical protein